MFNIGDKVRISNEHEHQAYFRQRYPDFVCNSTDLIIKRIDIIQGRGNEVLLCHTLIGNKIYRIEGYAFRFMPAVFTDLAYWMEV